MNIDISRKQRLFLQSKAKGTIYRGGIRSGKTYILCIKAILNALVGRRQLVISFSFPMLRDVVLFTFLEVLPKFGLIEDQDYYINKTEMIITLRGTQILLRSGDNPNNIRGISCADFFIDESREFKDDEAFLVALGRISDIEDAQWFICSSPKGKDWTYELCSDPEVNLIVQKTSENPFLPRSYIRELRKRYTSKFAQQELEASIIELGAGIIDSSWFKYVDRLEYKDAIRAWDLAVSIKTQADFTAGAWCSMIDSKLYIRHMVHGKFEYPDLKKKIIATAQMDGTDTIISLEQAGQQLGYIDDLKKNTPELLPYTIKSRVPEGDKLNRALPWITRAEAGNVFLVRGPWNAKFTDECRDFAADMSHLHDDQIDAVSQAYALLSKHSVVQAGRVRY